MFPSTKSYNPNDLIAFWTPFTRVFQWFCVSNFSLFRSDSMKNHRIRYLARIIYFVIFSLAHFISIAMASNYFSRDLRISHSKYRESPSMYYVKMAGSIFGPLAHTIIHIEALLNGSNENQLYERFSEIHRIFATKLNYVIDYNKLSIRYGAISGIFIVPMIFTGVSFFYIEVEMSSQKSYLRIIMVATLITRCREYQITLALTALKDTLVDLEILLQRHQIEHNRTQQHPENIQYFRKIYSNAWLIKNLISDCYGWTMIALLAQVTLDMIQSAYWLFVNLKYFNSRNFTLRESFLCMLNAH